jgi:peptide/nickel transport system permease protein
LTASFAPSVGEVAALRPRLKRRFTAQLIVGGGIAIAIALVAVFATWIAPYPYDLNNYNVILAAPSNAHLFGTDEFGRDILSRVVVGARISLAYGVGSSLLSLCLGVPVGLWAGYIGGRVDDLIMRTLDLMMSIPPLLFGLVILAVTPPAIWKTIVAISIALAPSAARLVRSATLSLRREEFVQAAQARGESATYIVAREVLPNVWPIIIVEAGLRVAGGLLLGAALSFLGLGAQPPSSDWGLMISDAQNYLSTAPWMAIFPGVVMGVTVIGFNLFGNGLRDLLLRK